MTKLQDREHARRHPEDFLPFVTRQANQLHYWCTVQTGDTHIDHCIGVIYGLYSIEYLRRYQTPEIAAEIARSMPRLLGKVEQGFIDAIADYLASGTVCLSGFDFCFQEPA